MTTPVNIGGSTQVAPWYCTREEVKYALDVKSTARNDAQVDRICDGVSRGIEGLLKRIFYPIHTTKAIDWPNFQYAYPWRIWLNSAELADVTVDVPVVTSGGDVISNAHIFWGNPRYSPPYTYFELDRSSNEAFGHGNTPQWDVHITGTFGYTIDTKTAGTLTAAVSDTTGTSITVSNGSLIGVGDQVLIDSERLLVTGRANVSSTQTLQTPLDAVDAEVTVAVTDGTKFNVNEVAQLDSEKMLIVDVTGNNLTVIRAWDGSVLAAHIGSTVYVSRQLTVIRGAQGTTAATHLNGAAVNLHVVPPLVKQLAVAEAVATLTLEAGAYAGSQGSEGSTQRAIGAGLPMLRDQARARYGRVARQRVI